MRFVFIVVMVVFAQSCGRTDSQGQPDTGGSAGNPGGLSCDNCFMVRAFDRYLALPTRYVVRRSGSDHCLVFTAPFADVNKELGTTQYAERLRTDSGLIRLCDRASLDQDIKEIVEKAGEGKTQNDGDIVIRSWSSAEMRTPFTATYFFSRDEGLLIFDVDEQFAERIWREALH